jgi:DNA-binding CsgD family transcriptional regulator
LNNSLTLVLKRKRISLSSKPSWIEAYYNLNLYQSSLFEEPAPGATASFNLWFGDEEKARFFANTPIHRFTFENCEYTDVNFSQRELACVKHLLDYKTAAETAVLMNVSTRTIESYLDNIKLKLNCTTKAELIRKLKNSPYLYLFE